VNTLGRGVAASVAASVDAPEELYPYLAELFKGMPSLGSSPRVVAGLLKTHGVTARSRVLDLACGKGAASLAVAGAIGCRVLGVDGYLPFIEAARSSARRRGLYSLTTYEHAALERWEPARRYDVAMMLGLWPLSTAARSLRMCVRAGGLYVIDDVFFDPEGGPSPKGHRRPPTLKRANAVITRLGDRVEEVRVFTAREVAAVNGRLFARLKVNAAALARLHPRLRAVLREYIERQMHANALLSTSFRPAIWVVRRSRCG